VLLLRRSQLEECADAATQVLAGPAFQAASTTAAAVATAAVTAERPCQVGT
jgi:hypothetical protein